ncbi:polyprenol phosphomannose-dependent alpha 1,6 mannosyltransferase MptB [Streptomyces sp. NBC_01754]|uniref:polyprenol phosphomannose-dependent alpha 1,6 mannosyltransferase MptB n=1 Tax=Streptomyces sp. NBC_01754 TaxID=2975930 RepID=UPI002DDC873D|nr:polyprenol phosphomannose-dependent alpha 1,6 mannosyltransferase MptB [Streptomyces sp. NBC_01754]WSC94205.1 polyprenol phosphomannose-dependent alpha 1,6 mannosyltransferase MptB [Streptomyces sp. NBC_01754]
MRATRAWSAVGCRRLGAAGAAGAALGGWAVGTLPAHDPWGLWVPHGTAVTAVGYALAYGGLTVLVVAWWLYGRTGAGVRDTLVTLLWWAAPFVLAPPLYSADVYSYLAQGAMVLEGHDVYSVGPSVLDPDGPGGDAAASVGGQWTDTPAPYGPFFLILARAVAWATGGAVVPGVLLMRLIALGALALTAWALLRLAREHGRDGGAALWLGALNPLLLTHVVGGLHNDGLMAALMLAGVACTLRGRWVTGSVLIGLAMMVKSPAAVALLFTGVVVGRAATGAVVRRVVKGLLGPGAVAGAVVVLVTLLGGTGFGWLGTQGVAGRIHTALSATSDLGLGLGHLGRLLFGTDPEPVRSAVQNLGLAAALVLIALLGWRSAVGRTRPVHALGLALLALVALSPMVQPWYLLWGTVVLAATAGGGRVRDTVVVLSAALVYETQPSGSTPAYGFVLAGLTCALGVLLVRRTEAEAEAEAGPGDGDGDGPSLPSGGATARSGARPLVNQRTRTAPDGGS